MGGDSEECTLCKMQVSSLKLHWKINHKNVKRSVLKKRQIGFNQKRGSTGGDKKGGNNEAKKIKLATCPECGCDNIENLDQHILLEHRLQARVQPSQEDSMKDKAELVKKKLQAFRTQNKFTSSFSEKELLAMRKQGDERARLFRNILTSICADKSTPQLVVCPFCSKKLFYGIIQTRHLVDRIRGPVKRHMVNCNPDLAIETQYRDMRKKEVTDCVDCEQLKHNKVKTEDGEDGHKSRSSIINIDGQCIHAPKRTMLDALGNPLDGSESPLTQSNLEDGFARNLPCLLTIEKTELLTSDEDKILIPSSENFTTDMSELVDPASSDLKCETVEITSCDANYEVEEKKLVAISVPSTSADSLSSEETLVIDEDKQTVPEQARKLTGGIRLVAASTEWRSTENIQSKEDDS